MTSAYSLLGVVHVGYEHDISLLTLGVVHVGYEHDISLLTLGVVHVGYEHDISLLTPRCGPRHLEGCECVGLCPQCTDISLDFSSTEIHRVVILAGSPVLE